MYDHAILAIAAFSAGVLNTIAGGGTFLTFPALVIVSLPPSGNWIMQCMTGTA